MANLPETEDFASGTYQIETSDRVIGGPGGIANKQAEQLGNRTAWLKAALAKMIDGTTAIGKATQLATARTLRFKGAASGSGSYDGSADTEITLTLADSGVSAGSFTKVTINAKGLVTGASSPTTLGGYGITDAFTKPETATAIQQAISSLVASSPEALDTLNELAAALGNDPNFATTMTNALSGKASKATTLGGYAITDAYTKTQVDTSLAGKASKATTIAGYGITDALVVGSGGWLSAPGIVTGSVSAITSSQLVSMTTPNTTDRPPNTQNSSGLHMIFAGGAYSADIAVGHNDTNGILQFRSSGGLSSGWRTAWHDGNFAPGAKINGDACLDAGFASQDPAAPYMRHSNGTIVRLQVDRPKDTATFGASGRSINADTGEILQWMEVLVGDIPAGGTIKNITWPFAFPNAFINAWTSIRVTSGTPQISNCYWSLGTVSGCRLQIDEGSQQVQPTDLTVIVFSRGR